MTHIQPAPAPVPSPVEPLVDVIIKLSYTPDDGLMQTELLDCYPWEVAKLLPALAKIRRRSWWPWAPVKHLTIFTRNGKRTTVFGDRITDVTTRPAGGGHA